MSNTLTPGAGDGMGLSFAALNPNISGLWFAQTAYTSIGDLLFVRLCSDGTVKFGSKNVDASGREDLAGWMLQPRLAWLDAKIGGGSDTENTDQSFEAVEGSWKTVPQIGDKNSGTGIYNTKSGANGRSKAQTIGTLPRNRQLCFKLAFTGQESDEDEMAARLSFGGLGDGNIYSLSFTHEQSIGIDRMYEDTTAATPTMTPSRVMTLDGYDPADLQRGRYFVQIVRIAGYLVVSINGRAFWNVDTETEASTLQQSTTTQTVTPMAISWGTGKVSLELNNCYCRLDMGVIKYAKADGTLFRESFTRSITRPNGIPDGAIESHSGGWKQDGTNISITSDSGSYTCELRASADGIDSPFVSKVLLYKEGTYTTPVAQSIDATGAVRSIKVRQQLPTQDARLSSYADIEFDMLMLREICKSYGVASLDYATSYRQIDVQVCWQDENGIPDSGTVDNPNYVPIFRGYTLPFSEQLNGFATHIRTVHAEDVLVQLDKPAGLIDHRYGPLDVFYCRKAGTALSNINQSPNPNGAVLYGYECVREILRVERGSTFANSLQVSFPSSHYPLIDARADRCGYLALQGALGGQAPYDNGFLFPPPYLESVMDWIRDPFQKLDRAVFFMSFPEDNRNAWPVPIYARLQHWLRTSGRQTWTAPDNIYTAGDIDRLILSLENETRADRDYNHVYSVSTPQGTDLGGILPGLRMSEAYTRYGPSRAPLSWRRSLVSQNQIAWYGAAGRAGVDGIAQGIRGEIEGVQAVWPKVSLPGNAYMAPGDKLIIKRELGGDIFGPRSSTSTDYSSPASFDGFSELTCRIEAVEHTITLENEPAARRFVTTPHLRPILNSGT